MNELTKQDRAVASAQLIPDEAKRKLAAFWGAHKAQITAVIAGGDDKAIAAATYSCLYRNPKLINCTPFSLLNGIVLGHQLGLRFGTSEVSLVPFGTEATLIIGYQGKAKLALQSGVITSISVELVFHGERFDYWRTQDGLHMFHQPDWLLRAKAADETNIIGAYCQLGTKLGTQTRFVPLCEVLQAREMSRGFRYAREKGGGDTPWITAFGAMAMKTAVHRAMKLAPQDGLLGLSGAVDDEEEGGAAVIAFGLNPDDFTAGETQVPLVDAADGRAAQLAIVEAKTGVIEDYPGWPFNTKSPFSVERSANFFDNLSDDCAALGVNYREIVNSAGGDSVLLAAAPSRKVYNLLARAMREAEARIKA